MKREKFLFVENETTLVNYKKISGHRRTWDKRLCEDPRSIEARECYFELKKKGESFNSLGEKIGVSGTTVSRLIGGNAGDRPLEERGGVSTTDYVLNGLRELVERKI